MKYGIATILICILLLTGLQGQVVQEIGKKELIRLTDARWEDTTYVINFWATWCSPCVKEIGYFEDLHRTYRDQKVKVILVSLDFPNQIQRRVMPFLEERDITAHVSLMTDLNYNDWIESVDPAWSGAIPATLIYRNNSRIFLEKELTREELFSHVTQIMN